VSIITPNIRQGFFRRYCSGSDVAQKPNTAALTRLSGQKYSKISTYDCAYFSIKGVKNPFQMVFTKDNLV